MSRRSWGRMAMAFCLLPALLALGPSPLRAQAGPAAERARPVDPPGQPVEPGDRIRLRTAGRERITGTLLEITPDVLRIQADADLVRIPTDGIASLERSLGSHRRFWRHFLVTTGAGAAAMGLLVAALDDGGCSDGPFGCTGPGGAFVLGAAVGAVVSLPVGVVVGLAVRSERWAPAGPPRPGWTR